MTAYEGTLSSTQQQSLWANFCTFNGITATTPDTPELQALFVNYIQSIQKNNVVLGATVNYSPDQYRANLVLSSAFQSVSSMLDTLQNTIAMQSGVLTSLGTQQQNYETMMSRVPNYVAGPGGTISVNTSDIANFTFGYDNTSLKDIIDWGANQALATPNTPVTFNIGPIGFNFSVSSSGGTSTLQSSISSSFAGSPLGSISAATFATAATTNVGNVGQYPSAVEALTNSYLANPSGTYTDAFQLPNNYLAQLSNVGSNMKAQVYQLDPTTPATLAEVPGFSALFNDPAFVSQFTTMIKNNNTGALGDNDNNFTYGGFTFIENNSGLVNGHIDALNVYLGNTLIGQLPDQIIGSTYFVGGSNLDANLVTNVWNTLLGVSGPGTYTLTPISPNITVPLPSTGSSYSSVGGVTNTTNLWSDLIQPYTISMPAVTANSTPLALSTAAESAWQSTISQTQNASVLSSLNGTPAITGRLLGNTGTTTADVNDNNSQAEQRGEVNAQLQNYIENIRSQESAVTAQITAFQTTISGSNTAITNQTNLLSAIVDAIDQTMQDVFKSR